MTAVKMGSHSPSPPSLLSQGQLMMWTIRSCRSPCHQCDPHHICRKITLYSAGAGCEYYGLRPCQTLLPGSTSTFSLDEDFQSESGHQFPCKSLSPLVTTTGTRVPCPVSCSPLVCVTPAPGPLQISSDMWGKRGSSRVLDGNVKL